MGPIIPNTIYYIRDFTKEYLETNLITKTVRFWTEDCLIMPDFDVTGIVEKVSYFKNSEIDITVRFRNGRKLEVGSRMVNLKFTLIS